MAEAEGSIAAEEGTGPDAPKRGGGGLTYREAGVDRAAAERAKRGIEARVRETYGPEVVSKPGSFGGLYRMPTGLNDPVLAASADGVGTKLKVAMRTGRHDTIGRDLVNHCVDDILVEGAVPLFFLDYIGMGRLDEGVMDEIVAGVAEGCRENGCALLGGETAELPDFYAPGEYDLAGFIVGAVEEGRRPGAERVQAGDALVGIASDGFHTNGYTLLRRVLFNRLGLGVEDSFPELDEPVGEVLLRVHRSYLSAVRPLLEAGEIEALAHITGGGIPGNLARNLPPEASARIERSTWSPPPEFVAVMDHGGVPEDEMWETFNMGVGMILVVRPDRADAMVDGLRGSGERAWIMGGIESEEAGVVLE